MGLDSSPEQNFPIQIRIKQAVMMLPLTWIAHARILECAPVWLGHEALHHVFSKNNFIGETCKSCSA
jgi:hypothetical protein